MRSLRCSLAIALVCCLARVAKADDFKMVVVDPTVPAYLLQPILTDNFSVTFPTTGPAAGCQASQLPGVTDLSDYTACFTGINLTGQPLTSLELEFPTFTYGGGTDSPVCPTSAPTDAFPDVSCTIINSGADYLLQFSGGDIPTATLFNSFCYFDPFGGNVDCDSPSIFTIAIGIPGVNLITSGIVTQDFNDPGVNAVANITFTPEPNSVLLTSTGIFSLALFGLYRRRLRLAWRSCPVSNRY